MTKRVGTDLLAADVHARLRARILSFEIKPGSRLVEDEISATMNVGRTPVREALLRLQGEGLVSREKGWVVESTDPSNMQAIFESRIAIEGYATRLAATRVTSADVTELEALVAEMDRFETMNRAQLNQLNRAFHRRIIEMSGNPLFVDMHEKTLFHYWNMRLPVIFTKEQTQAANEQHKVILTALTARREAEAEEAAREHESFTLMTPEGHMLAGWITFSAERAGDVTVVQIQALERTNDPLYELGYMLGGNRLNSRFWIQTAENLARHLGVASPEVDSQVVCVDRRRQWHRAGNLSKNAALRTFVWTLGTPVRWLGQPLTRRRPGES